MMRLTNTGSVIQVAVALGLALVVAPMVRNVTAELNNTVGRAWPFSLVRCVAVTTPGCADMFVQSAQGLSTPYIRTGRL